MEIVLDINIQNKLLKQNNKTLTLYKTNLCKNEQNIIVMRIS